MTAARTTTAVAKPTGIKGTAALRLAVVGPTRPQRGRAAAHTTALAHQLAAAGHEVVLVSWSRHRRGEVPDVAPYPRTERVLSWARPGTWVRAGRRLRHMDAILVVPASPRAVPALLALVRAAGATRGGAVSGRPERPRSIVLAPGLVAPNAVAPNAVAPTPVTHERRAGDEVLAWLLRHVDAALVHSADEARRARSLGAARVCVAELPPPPGDGPPPAEGLRYPGQADPSAPGRRRAPAHEPTQDLPGPWARYLGTIEALAADESGWSTEPPTTQATGTSLTLLTRTAAAGPHRNRIAHRLRTTARGHLAEVTARRIVRLAADDLPGWVLATDALVDPRALDATRRLVRGLGLPRAVDGVAAWAALGALAVIIRVRDDGRRSAVIVDETGRRSTFSRWARTVGFAPVDLDVTGAEAGVPAVEVDTGSLDVIVRIHPRGCDRDDIDHVLEQATWSLRPGGLLVVTLPLGPRDAAGALGPAEVRGVIARAHDLGYLLVGDLDGDVTQRMREGASRARAGTAAYGLVRLTFRRR